jgi:hypothetical protein
MEGRHIESMIMQTFLWMRLWTRDIYDVFPISELRHTLWLHSPHQSHGYLNLPVASGIHVPDGTGRGRSLSNYEKSYSTSHLRKHGLPKDAVALSR